MKNNKGITLIALVITIIVLLILAGITIAMLTGENGILSNATKSKAYNELGAAKDKVGLTVSEAITEYFNTVYVSGTTAQYSKTGVRDKAIDAVADMETGKDLPVGVDFDNNGAAKPVKTGNSIGVFTLRYGDYTIEGTIDNDGKLTWKDIEHSPANS